MKNLPAFFCALLLSACVLAQNALADISTDVACPNNTGAEELQTSTQDARKILEELYGFYSKSHQVLDTKSKHAILRKWQKLVDFSVGAANAGAGWAPKWSGYAIYEMVKFDVIYQPDDTDGLYHYTVPEVMPESVKDKVITAASYVYIASELGSDSMTESLTAEIEGVRPSGKNDLRITLGEYIEIPPEWLDEARSNARQWHERCMA